MANIFSGLFNNQNAQQGNAFRLAKYKQELEDYETATEEHKQKQALEAMSPQLRKVYEGFGPERQEMGRLAEIMLGHPASYDRGEMLLGDMTSQRGLTLKDIAANAEKLKRFKAERDYKLAHPDPLDRTAWAQDIDTFNALGDGSDNFTKAQLDALEIKSKEQFLDLESGYQSARDKEKFIAKQIARARFEEALGETGSKIYFGFNDTLDATDTFMSHMMNKRGDVQQLYGLTRDNTVGWASIAQLIPGTGPKKWQDLAGTVVANIGIDKLLEMKESSPSGASGMGALSDTEMKILITIAGNLTQSSNVEDIKKNLRRLDIFYSKMERTRKQKLTTMHRKNTAAERSNYIPEIHRNYIPENQRYLLNIPGAVMPVEETPLPTAEEEAGTGFKILSIE
jgi:hypothetical protein